ncbi:hydroxyproline-rich glycoprotein family protein [Rhynchospora pubera]|uniref:Hydroxyproline-rich glycoprotein family protein n=1 Tax=Rhynchospora pubera TaxID=906938 RepID=A0AAV8FCB5_9POAL|nr:hydroxyproline-rich glycoprotein family protein [Rhynchospora pubera]
MKSPLRKFRGFGRHESREVAKKKTHPPPSQLDELVHASEEVQEMRNCYDSLLSAAAATLNSVFEFSEALEEMGTCLLEKTAMSDDDDSGRVLMQIGKAQFELQEIIDTYRSNVLQTITKPSESLLKELQTVEEMKRQCDEKREYYNYVLSSYRERGRLRHISRGSAENFSSEDVQAALQDYQDEAALFVFRLKSLQQGQFRSLLTQAARHYAAQLSFFRKGLKHLEAVEPHVKAVAEQQHIDFNFAKLDDDDDDENSSDIYNDDDGEDDDGFSMDDDSDRHSRDGQLSFEHKSRDLPISRSSMEIDQVNQATDPEPLKEYRKENISQFSDMRNTRPKPNPISQSAPLFAIDPTQTQSADPYERFRNMRPSSTRKCFSYALPVPDENLSSKANTTVNSSTDTNNSSGTNNRIFSTNNQPTPSSSPVAAPAKPARTYQSSPLPKQYSFKPATYSKSGPLRMPPQKIRREAYSGPIRPGYTSNTTSAQPPRSTSPNLFARPTHPPPRTSSSPLISELHELPRPPMAGRTAPVRSSQLVGYSGPLMPRRPSVAASRASPLPTPPQPTLTRTYSIPSSTDSQRMPAATIEKLEGRKGILRTLEPIVSEPDDEMRAKRN